MPALPIWIKLWLMISSTICTIDIFFTMLRPASLPGGSLENVFYLWNIYSQVDIRYGTANDLVTHTTGRLMIFEIALNLLALFLDLKPKYSRHAMLVAFTTTVMVWWKTVVYLALYIDVPEGNRSQIVAGTSGWKVFWVFWVMNGFWVVVPILIMYYLWNPLVHPESNCDLPNELEETKSLIAVELPSESKRKTVEPDEDKSSKETSVAIERGHA